MRTDLFDDLGSRLDDLAAANAPRVDYRQASNTALSVQRRAFLGVASLIIVAIITWVLTVGPNTASRTHDPANPASTDELGLPGWVELPVFERNLIQPRQPMDDVIDLTTARLLAEGPDFYAGLSPDHSRFVLVWEDTSFGVPQTFEAPAVRLLNSSLQLSVAGGEIDGAIGFVPRSVIAVESHGGVRVATDAGWYRLRGIDNVTNQVRWDTRPRAEAGFAPIDGMTGAELRIDIELAGEPVLTTINDVLCLRTEHGLMAYGLSVSQPGDSLQVDIDPGARTVEIAVQSVDGNPAGAAVFELDQADAASPSTVSYQLVGEALVGTMRLTCPDTTPHLTDLVAAMRGQ